MKLVGLLTAVFLVSCGVVGSSRSVVFAVEPGILDSNIVADRPCEDVLAIFARGSGQNGGAGNPNNDISLRAVEAESYRFFSELEAQIHSTGHQSLTVDWLTLQDFPHKYSPIGYLAAGVVTDIVPYISLPSATGIGAFVHSGSGKSTYGYSVYNGSIELSGFLSEHMLKCPNQLIYLGGYSQGADVVASALWLMHDEGLDDLISRIAHVALYGDPRASLYTGFGGNNPKQPYARGNSSGIGLPALGARDPSVPEVLLGKFTSWCDRADIVCNGINPYTSKKSPGQAHQNKYKDKYIAESAVEMVLSTQSRLAELSGTDQETRRSGKPISGRTLGLGLDIMMALDVSTDMDKRLLGGSKFTLNESFRLIEEESPLARAGLTVFNEHYYSDRINPSWVMPLDLSVDSYAAKPTDYSPIRTYVGQYTFNRFEGGGSDKIDSLLGALSGTITSASWLESTDNILVYFTNSYGRSPEPVTSETIQDTINKALDKEVKILPVYYPSGLESGDPEDYRFIQNARRFHNQLADATGGHVSEIYKYYEGKHELYDVLQGHYYAPDIEIELPARYIAGDRRPNEISIGVGSVQELTAYAEDADSYISNIDWDLNNDGIYDTEGETVLFSSKVPGDYLVTVQATSFDGVKSRDTIAIVVGDEPNNLQVYNPPAIDDITAGLIDDLLTVTWTTDNKSPTDWVRIIDSGEVLVSVAADMGGVQVGGYESNGFYPELQVVGPGGRAYIPLFAPPVEVPIDGAKEEMLESEDQAGRIEIIYEPINILEVYRVQDNKIESIGTHEVEYRDDSQSWMISIHRALTSGRHVYLIGRALVDL